MAHGAGLPAPYWHAERREILDAPADRPAQVSDVGRMYILPRPTPLIRFLRAPGAANILRSAAALYMLLRRDGCPALDPIRAHVLRLEADHGPTRRISWTTCA